jgi:hypothetical protein
LRSHLMTREGIAAHCRETFRFAAHGFIAASIPSTVYGTPGARISVPPETNLPISFVIHRRGKLRFAGNFITAQGPKSKKERRPVRGHRRDPCPMMQGDM